MPDFASSVAAVFACFVQQHFEGRLADMPAESPHYIKQRKIIDKEALQCMYLRFEAPGDIGVDVAAGAGCGSDFSCLVGEAEPVLVFIMPMLE